MTCDSNHMDMDFPQKRVLSTSLNPSYTKMTLDIYHMEKYQLPCFENDLGQYLQGNGLFPLCILICCVKPSLVMEDLKHCRQENDINSHQNGA